MKLKKHVFTILLVVLLFLLIGSVSATDIDANNTQIASASGNDEILSMENDVNILSAGEYTYNDLKEQINSGGDIILIKGNYTYAESDGGTIEITTSRVIDGNGAVIDMAQSGHRAFYITTAGVTIKNLTIKNANYKGSGGAIYFSQSGTVENCNFINNTATDGGAVYFRDKGNVTNCNFTNNKATANRCWGGAVFFWGEGNVRNCNFINNTANPDGGAVYFRDEGNVTNCNFTNNKAIGSRSWGGAVYFEDDGKVTNCSFTGNKADFGSAIYFYKYLPTDTLTISNSIFLNNRANAKDLQVTRNENNITITFTGQNNFLNAIYSRNDTEVTFTNVTYWSAKGISNTGSSAIKPSRSNKEAGQNITVSIVVNDILVLSEVKVTDENGMIVLDISVGENYFIGVRHDTDSYYTEATYTTSNNIKFNVNVTSQTTTNRTVNITAKSNIPNEIIDGKLLFILPNGTEINATYATNGIWWTLHTFDYVGDYNINATYIGLDDVTINNATISIRYDARVNVNNKTLDLFVGDNFTIVATTTPEGLNVTYVQDDSGVYIVDENGVVTALKNGTGSVLVKIGGDGVYAENSTIVNITVSKVPTEIKVTNATLDLKVDGEIETGATLIPADAGNLTYTINNPSIVKVEDGKIIALKEGNATITVSFTGNKKYLPAENKTVNVTVRLNDASVKVNNNTLNLLVDETFNLISTTEPKDLTVNYTSSNPSVVTVDNKGNVIAVSEGNATITVTVGGDGKYVENSTTVTVTVSKVPTEITLYPASLDLFVGDETVIAANLTPPEAGNVTFTSSDENIVTVDNQGNVIAEGKGQAIITISFAGDNKYAAAENKTINVTVKKLNPIIDVSADDITEGENATISVTLHDDATGNVTTTVDGKSYYSPVENGNAIITIPDLEYGNYTLPITYSGDDKYNPLTKDVNLTVKEDEIIVSAQDLTKYYSGPEPFTVNVAYANGRVVEGKEVKITVNGVTYRKTTDENGTVSLNINLNAGTYDVAVEVDNITADYMVTVLSTINASDIESKTENLVFTASFIDGEGNYLVDGTNVSFNIKGVIYDSQVTGDKGSASINLTLGRGRYIITSYNPVSDEYASNSIAVDLKDVVMTLFSDEITVGENATIIVTLPGDASGNVTAVINGKTYNNHVNDGKASIIIPDLIAGIYPVPVKYSGDNKYNGAKGDINVTVNKADATIGIDAPSITEGDNAIVTVTLPGDATGRVTVGNEVVTVKEGTASVVLTGLTAGITTVPVTYSGDDKYNPIETSVNVTVNSHPVPPKEDLNVSV
ncbi:Ig-like domain repeat protein, partial [uncultured Methanobrevibacter sp.]|uniref:Ig-like domain repeat protein n=1 Tax=uncultured Methanobrevibacter sp. TaxID=253161 RepID=UPI0025EDA8CF